MDVRVATIRVVVLASTFLAVRLDTAALDGLVSTDVEPCTITEDGSSGAERVGDGVHRATLVLAERVLCRHTM